MWYIYLLLLIQLPTCFPAYAETWKTHWQEGLHYYSLEKNQDAAMEFDQAINLIAEEDRASFPFVFVDCAENDYILQNYEKVMLNTEIALKSQNLTDHERLTCGLRRIATFVRLNDEDSAIQEYKKYIIGCPLLPKYDYSDDKIIIRNMLSCDYYKTATRNRLISKYCINPENIHEYNDKWIIDVTKKCSCGCSIIKAKKSPQEIEACCNTCNKLAIASNFICCCLSMPPQLGGPITANACKLLCIALVEDIRQECERCCKFSDGKCWGNFETWKEQYKKENPGCGCPPIKCP